MSMLRYFTYPISEFPDIKAWFIKQEEKLHENNLPVQ